MNPLATLARRAGLGRAVWQLWYRPVGRITDCLRNGGPWAERETERYRQAMEHAADSLPTLPAPAPELRLHLLTGRRFWYQTAFCLHSWATHGGVPVTAELYDDGTLDASIASRLTRLGPAIRIHPYQELTERLDRWLPRSRFPVLRERWDHYPNIRKLTDPHLDSAGWKLVIDSDLLFFRAPTLLNDWLAQPDRILHATDCMDSYGYSRPLLEELAGAPLPPRVNVGLCGLRSEDLDWDLLERWCTELQRRERTNYYLEQALVAMLAARHPCRTIAPAADYVTKPSREEVARPTAVMHHYVAESKRWYYQMGWRTAVA